MLKRIGLGLAVLVVSAAPAFAQPRAEVGIFLGWTFSDGVSGQSILAGDGNIYDRVDPKDSVSWGFDVGVFVSPSAEVGFIYQNQPTTLEIGGTNTREVGDLSVNQYHGYFAYNFGEPDAPIRPYILAGFGATSYGDVNFTRLNGASGTIGGSTKYSSTIGAGIKGYPSPHVGYRAGVRWTPTYIKSDAAGYWCDPYWGCYVVGDAQYSNAFDFNGGVTFRF